MFNQRYRAHPDGTLMIIMLGVFTAFAPLSIDLYLPGMPAMEADFGVSAGLVQQSLSLFFVGLAGGQLLYGPLADRFGRRYPLLAGSLIYLAAGLLCALAPSIEWLLAGRLLQGFGAAAGPVIARAIVRDVYAGRRAAQVMSFVILVMTLAPLIAPVVGGWLTTALGWRANFWALVAFAVICLVMLLMALPETHPAERRPRTALRHLFAGYLPILRDRAALAYLGAGGMAFAALFAYVAGSPFVYTRVFGVAESNFGYFFALNVIGLLIGNLVNSRLVMHFGQQIMLTAGVLVMATASVSMLVMALAGITEQWLITPALFVALGTVGIIAANTVSGLLDRHPRHAGAASALFGVAQFGLGALSAVGVGLVSVGPLLTMTLVMAAAALVATASVIALWWQLRRPALAV
ncbi:Drug resistance transporter, Bcr/CflA subfamily protein [Spiribacter salinus M19-40]|uniref:Bcr/CflA family efflux transporter n=1 Tax=Spiribacter salinus M19-40 TaxID=1260251 RepID=R4VIP6_9GAMM|nr:Bcr/CflA family multidrug efflux MFS transporter [Spiribacter salinus]AGM40467.1 Drug resistance transporter, Bcr/CflA subfamily protein [Spiribacter salinus M19-40]MBY5269389.1 transporter [Spiribacter salinus]